MHGGEEHHSATPRPPATPLISPAVARHPLQRAGGGGRGKGLLLLLLGRGGGLDRGRHPGRRGRRRRQRPVAGIHRQKRPATAVAAVPAAAAAAGFRHCCLLCFLPGRLLGSGRRARLQPRPLTRQEAGLGGTNSLLFRRRHDRLQWQSQRSPPSTPFCGRHRFRGVILLEIWPLGTTVKNAVCGVAADRVGWWRCGPRDRLLLLRRGPNSQGLCIMLPGCGLIICM